MLITLARKPLKGNVVANVLAHGTGALNIDQSRIAGIDPKNAVRLGRQYTDNADRSIFGIKAAFVGGSLAGRWPANVLIGSEAALAGFPETHCAGSTKKSPAGKGLFGMGGNHFRDTYGKDGTNAARFFKKVGASEC